MADIWQLLRLASPWAAALTHVSTALETKGRNQAQGWLGLSIVMPGSHDTTQHMISGLRNCHHKPFNSKACNVAREHGFVPQNLLGLSAGSVTPYK